MNNNILYLIAAVALYIFAPPGYNLFFCIILAVLFLFIGYKCVKKDFKSEFYLSINVILFIGFFLTTFIVPLFLEPAGFMPLSLSQYINKCTALVVVAVVSYYIGWNSIEKRETGDEQCEIVVPQNLSKTFNFLFFLTTLIYVLYFIAFMNNKIGDGNNLGVAYLIPLLQSTSVLAMTLSCLSAQQENRNLLAFIFKNRTIIACFCLIIITSIAYIGDRTMPLFLVISFLATYVYWVKPISFYRIILYFIAVAIIMLTVGFNRSDSKTNLFGNSAVETAQTTLRNTDGIEDVFIDFIPAQYDLYLCKSWKEDNGYYYPAKLVVIAVNPIPYLPSLLSQLLYGKEKAGDLNSDKITTKLFDQNVQATNSGMGTHAVGDIYISWGILGVIIIFLLFGKLLAYLRYNYKKNIYVSIAWIIFLADSLYIPRATIFDCYRTVVFALFLLWLVKNFSKTQISYR